MSSRPFQDTPNPSPFYQNWEGMPNAEAAALPVDSAGQPRYTTFAHKVAVGALAVIIPVAGLEALHVANQWATHGADVDPASFIVDLEILAASGLGIRKALRTIRNTP